MLFQHGWGKGFFKPCNVDSSSKFFPFLGLFRVATHHRIHWKERWISDGTCQHHLRIPRIHRDRHLVSPLGDLRIKLVHFEQMKLLKRIIKESTLNAICTISSPTPKYISINSTRVPEKTIIIILICRSPYVSWCACLLSL